MAVWEVCLLRITKQMIPLMLAALLLSSCAGKKDLYNEGTNISSAPVADNAADVEGESFYYRWKGEVVSVDYADKQNAVLLGKDNAEGVHQWQEFLIDLDAADKAELTVCTPKSVMLVTENESGNAALIQIKQRENGKMVTKGRTVSPVVLCRVRDEQENRYDYYLSDCKIYSTPADDEGNDCREIPAELKSYAVDSSAAVTFPYQKRFSSYGDFEDYYSEYHESLGLDEVKNDMDMLEEDGSFNTNVVFLYGALSSGNCEYELLRAVEEDGRLVIYVKRKITEKTGDVNKWQLTCQISSEYLSDVSPDSIEWVVYDDEESRG